jgi:beta-glucanase (GH16 family)
MRTRKLAISLLTAIVLAGGLSCNRPRTGGSGQGEGSPGTGVTTVLVESETVTGSSDGTRVQSLESGGECVVIPADGWISFEVPVEVAGRYRSMVRLTAADSTAISCWIEDYFDNPDGRTYNITGDMESGDSVIRGRLITLQKEGSPLNSGTHRMKLHVDRGEALVDWIKFELIREHRQTPQLLTQHMEGDEWVVTWQDEFETGTMPDTSKWTYDIGNWGWGNNELQYYTVGRPENARIENGSLVIEARRGDLGEKWTSARITTRGKTSFLYGRIEFRAKLPAQRGNWAAGWTLGDAYVDELSWPYCGEIDIMESVGYEIDDVTGKGRAHASIHCGAYYFKLNNQPTAITGVKDMSGQFHTYSVEWTPEHIRAFVDELPYLTYEDTSDSLTWPFNQPQNIILNLAMGGGWGGARGMDKSMTSQQLVIDYVRVYALQ